MLFARSAIISFLIVCSPLLIADTVYVDINADGLNNGTSWDDAYTSIGSALGNAVDDDEIIVAEGLYSEYVDMDGLAVTLRSTDPNDPNVVAATIVDGGGVAPAVTCDTGEDVDTLIQGFTLQNGDGSSNGFGGGGVYCKNSNPVISKCVFISNTATYYGGGVFCHGGSPTLSSCKFLGNTAGYGGGLSCYQSNAMVNSCVFSGNSSSNHGGGIHTLQASPTIINCSFSQNSTSFGGAMYCSQGSPSVINSLLWGDSATNTNEVYSSGSMISLDYCSIEGGWTGSGANNVIINPGYNDPDGDDDTAGTVDDDLSLDPYSRCINAGDLSGDYDGLADVDAQPRLAYGQVDMGADEVFPIGADLNEDGQVDTDDLVSFADGWVTEVNLSDFVFFAEQWLYGVELVIVE
jgi:predicted outer membrane repeat protein